MQNIFKQFILLDAARMQERMEEAQMLNPEFESLYREKAEKPLASVAPYLFTHSPESAFESWLLEKGWGNAWGVFVKADISFDSLYAHFRKFLMVKTEDGEQLYFRFYDPRVLSIFLPTCNEDQIIEFFGPVEKFIIEGDTRETAIEYTHQNGILTEQKIGVEVFFEKQSIPFAKKTEILPVRKKRIIIEEEPVKAFSW